MQSYLTYRLYVFIIIGVCVIELVILNLMQRSLSIFQNKIRQYSDTFRGKLLFLCSTANNFALSFADKYDYQVDVQLLPATYACGAYALYTLTLIVMLYKVWQRVFTHFSLLSQLHHISPQQKMARYLMIMRQFCLTQGFYCLESYLNKSVPNTQSKKIFSMSFDYYSSFFVFKLLFEDVMVLLVAMYLL